MLIQVVVLLGIVKCGLSQYEGWHLPEYCASLDYIEHGTKIPPIGRSDLTLRQVQVRVESLEKTLGWYSCLSRSNP